MTDARSLEAFYKWRGKNPHIDEKNVALISVFASADWDRITGMMWRAWKKAVEMERGSKQDKK